MKGDTMTYEHSFANSQWRSGTQPEAIVNWPPIEEDTMTDGQSSDKQFLFAGAIFNPEESAPIMTDRADRIIGVEPIIDLTTFAQWIELQPIAVHVGLLELIGNDIYRRKQWPTIAGEIKHAARDLRALSRHGGEI